MDMIEEQPLLSIIVPVYNAEKYIANTINSVLEQQYDNFELLLVDDGSTDNSKMICQKYSGLDSRIRLITKENGGVSSARNEGLNAAKGEYIAFLDSDDYVANDMYYFLVDNIVRSNSDISICGYYYVTEEEYKTLRNKNNEGINEPVSYIYNPIEKYYELNNMPPIWNKVYKRRVVEHMRFNESISYGEDLLFSSMAVLNSECVCYSNKKAYYYIKRKNSLSWQEGDIDFWNGYIESKKIIYDTFGANNMPNSLIKKAFDEYCKAVISLYRFLVHKRLAREYINADLKYHNIIMRFIKFSTLSFVKKLEYFSFIYSYKIAVLIHKKY